MCVYPERVKPCQAVLLSRAKAFAMGALPCSREMGLSVGGTAVALLPCSCFSFLSRAQLSEQPRRSCTQQQFPKPTDVTASGEGESVPAGWLWLRCIQPLQDFSWHLEETMLLLLLFRRNLVLPGQDLAAFAARQESKLMLSLFQCFPPLLHLLLSGDWG